MAPAPTATTTKEPVIIDASAATSPNGESTVMLDEDILKLRPLGAGQEVGRSCIYMEFKGKKILMDMGIHPGLNGMESLPFVDLIDPEEIDLLLISHFHLDHCGALPWFLTKTNFRGRCFMTHATKAIYRWLLADCIKVSNISTEMMLYTEADLERSMEKIEVINFHEEKEVAGVRFWCYNAGHVLGAAMFMLEIAGVKILYTGDFSRQEDRHLMSAEIPAILPDVLIIESTYGTHIHEPREDREARFTGIVYDTVTRGGRCLIPVFALGRAQELLLILDEYWSQHPELHDIPIYYASSLAKKCMSVYQTYISAMNSRIKRQIAINNPFVFKHISNLKSIDHFEDVGPCVVMATPGMMQSGLSRELFEAWCGHRANCCIIAGYCVEGTLAKQILSEPEEIVAQSGQKLPRRCQIEYISFSAHTDYRQTSEFVRALRPPHIVMVHGEANEMGRLKAALMREYEDTEAPPAFHNPKNTVAVELHFRGEKIAKVMGALATRPPAEGLRLSGVLVKRNFAYHLLAPEDLHRYTDMVVSTVDQRLTVPLAGGGAAGESFEAMVAALDGLALAVLEEGVSVQVMRLVKVSYDPKPKAGPNGAFPALLPPPTSSSSTSAANTSTTTTSSSPSPVAVLEWTSSPVADLVADSIVALLIKGTLSEKEVAALTASTTTQSKDAAVAAAELTKPPPKKKSGGKVVSAAAKELLFTNFLIDSLREMFNLEEEDFTLATREVEVLVTEEVPEEEEGEEEGEKGDDDKKKKKSTAEQPPPPLKIKDDPMMAEEEEDEMEVDMPQQAKRSKKTRETLRRETHKIVAFKVDSAEAAGEHQQQQKQTPPSSSTTVEVDISSKQLLRCELETVRSMVSRLLIASADIAY